MKKLTISVFTFLFFTHALAQLPKGIIWHTAKVETAFALAKKESKPLFLYWGAVWCPPCNYIKKNIFSTEIFKKEVINFIPVYLDGDSLEAQTWGEKLKTLGYPTMLILNSDGLEIMRLPIGVSAENYVNMMKQSRDTQLIMSERLEKAKIGKASDNDWELLAGYSWEQDPVLSSKLSDLYQKVPEKLATVKSRLFIQQLLVQEKPDQNAEYFYQILQNQTLVEASLMSFIDQTPKLFGQVYGANKQQMNEAAKVFTKTLEKIFLNPKLVFNDQVGLYSILIAIDNMLLGKISDLHLKQIKNVAKLASKKSKGSFERQSVMSTVVDLLIKAHDYETAKEFCQKEIKISKSPFYFMSDLAEIAKLENDYKASVSWAKKAWESSSGANTRFQWGVQYLNKLFEFEAENVATVKKELLEVLKVALLNEEAFKGRNLGRFEKLSKKLKDWGSHKARSEALTQVKLDVTQLCSQNKITDLCSTWLKTF